MNYLVVLAQDDASTTSNRTEGAPSITLILAHFNTSVSRGEKNLANIFPIRSFGSWVASIKSLSPSTSIMESPACTRISYFSQ